LILLVIFIFIFILILILIKKGSNGNPKNPKSLHYNAPGYVNEYESAIRSIGDILMYYDADKKFPTFGFGKIKIIKKN
jgi:hypothetical protein